MAAEKSHEDIVKLLIRNGADINVKNRVSTALILIPDIVLSLLLLLL